MRHKGGKWEGLEVKVKVPTFFRCPISLEVMRSPVSLCTGVTYDRSSIQGWLDSGHRTCPATALPLGSPVHLVPNLTLRSLIRLWSSSTSATATASPSSPPPILPPPPPPDDLLNDLCSSSDPLPPLCHLSAFFSSPNSDSSDKNRLASSLRLAPALVSHLINDTAGSQIPRLAVNVLSVILGMDCIEESGRELAAAALLAKLDHSVSALINILKSGEEAIGSRIDAARVLESILLSPCCDGEKRISIVEQPDLLPEVVRLLPPHDDGGSVDPEAADAALRCMLAAAKGRRARAAVARAGTIPALARVLATKEVPAAAAERALRTMEAAAGSSEGRTAICEVADACVGAVMGRMLKVGREGREAAVAVLWAACVAAGDERAREAVVGAKGAAAKILVVMQGECSPTTARMAGELLRMFKVDAKGCSVGYDTKTTHIMPY